MKWDQIPEIESIHVSERDDVARDDVEAYVEAAKIALSSFHKRQITILANFVNELERWDVSEVILNIFRRSFEWE